MRTRVLSANDLPLTSRFLVNRPEAISMHTWQEFLSFHFWVTSGLNVMVRFLGNIFDHFGDNSKLLWHGRLIDSNTSILVKFGIHIENRKILYTYFLYICLDICFGRGQLPKAGGGGRINVLRQIRGWQNRKGEGAPCRTLVWNTLNEVEGEFFSWGGDTLELLLASVSPPHAQSSPSTSFRGLHTIGASVQCSPCHVVCLTVVVSIYCYTSFHEF